MSDIATGETPADPVSVPPAPELAAEVEAAPDAAPPEAAEPLAETPAPEAEAPGDAPGERPISPLRQMVLDALLDSETPLTVAEIIGQLPLGTTRNTAESAIKRAYDAGEIERVAPGTYRLAPEKPPEQPKPVTPPQAATPDDVWLIALERFFENPAGWNVLDFGPPPDQPDNQIPHPIRMRFADRIRKREERRKDREAALARQAEADAALHNRLIAGCFNNVILGAAGLQDMAPVKAMLADGVPLEHVLIGLKRTVDRRIEPRAAPNSTMRDYRFLINVARSALPGGLLPKLVATWGAAGTAPTKAVECAEVSPATPAAPEPENAPAAPPANGIAPAARGARSAP